jgi:hypothetical protein
MEYARSEFLAGTNMNKCWASCLGDCDGGMSREHIVSESLFESEYIDVSGYSWCKEGPKRIGLGSFTKKALCRKHNSNLSKVDTAGAHAFRVLREQTKLTFERGKEPNKKYPKVSFSVDASGLELWILKTLINISYGGEHFVGPNSHQRGLPSDDLVRAVFGQHRLPASAFRGLRPCAVRLAGIH